MSNQLTLAFTVDVAGTSYGPAKAAAALAAVSLYANPTNDPVLGQLFGLTVASDTQSSTAMTVTRTIVLNMTSAKGPTAPPPFPCNPITATPPVLEDATLSYFGEVGLFAIGDTVTGVTSGAIATVVEVDDNGSGTGTLFFVPGSVVGNFRAGEVLTGFPSGAHATVGSLDYGDATIPFAVGDTVTGAISLATGVVAGVTNNGLGAGTLTFSSTTGVFALLEVLTGSPSGATALSGTAVTAASYYPLLKAEPLPGFFLTTPGSVTVGTSDSQIPSLVGGETIQFLAQPGVFYTVAALPVPTSITLTTPFTGPFSADKGAVEMVPAPAKIAAVYSTSPLDSNGVAITPPLVAGSGARTVSLTYLDSKGAGPFNVIVNLMGTYPSPVTLALGSQDIATITDLHVAAVGGFGNSVGQITLCELASVPPPILSNRTAQNFQSLTDQAQMLITRGLAYLPPSYFALAQQGASEQGASGPSLAGNFILPGRFARSPLVQPPLAPGGTSVATTVNQTAVLSVGNTIEFATQPGVLYVVAAVGSGTITLATPYTGLNDNPIASSATLVTPSPATPPTTAQLSGGVGEFVNPGTAVPPPNPPLAPQKMSPSPVFLSGLFARTLQLALAVPVVPSAILVS
jgi:hypothetical protein